MFRPAQRPSDDKFTVSKDGMWLAKCRVLLCFGFPIQSFWLAAFILLLDACVCYIVIVCFVFSIIANPNPQTNEKSFAQQKHQKCISYYDLKIHAFRVFSENS